MKYPTPHLRAEGNLSYLQFIRLVEYLWLQGHPEIPFEPAGNELPARYPSIIYAMQLSKTHPNEPKPHFREILDKDGNVAVVVSGQRFQNVVTFSAVTEKNPHLAEELIESFEDFMLSMVPVLKRAGLSELVYARRLPDREETRPGEGVVWRTTSYMVTTEKIVTTQAEKLRQIDLDVRKMLEQTTGFFTVNPEDSSISIIGDDFSIGDLVQISYRSSQSHPSNLFSGFYRIGNIVAPLGQGYGDIRHYFLIKQDATPHELTDIGPGSGYILKVEDDFHTEIVDQFAGATPDQDF